MSDREPEVPEEKRIEFRIGINDYRNATGP
jgi:hypothetical protein